MAFLGSSVSVGLSVFFPLASILHLMIMCYKELFVFCVCVDFASVSEHCQDLNSHISDLTLILWKILCLGCRQYRLWLQFSSLKIEMSKIMTLSVVRFSKI